MKRIYAVTHIAPDGSDYLTAGKRYEVYDDDGQMFHIKDDEGYQLNCLWTRCPHLNDANWTRMEESA